VTKLLPNLLIAAFGRRHEVIDSRAADNDSQLAIAARRVLDVVVFHGANVHGQLPHIPGALFSLLAVIFADVHCLSRLTSCWGMAQASPLWPPQSLLLSHDKPRTQPLRQRLQ